MAATDPVAVVVLFSNMGALRRLTTLLDGESLLNEGMAIVFFTLRLTLIAGSNMMASGLTLQFLACAAVRLHMHPDPWSTLDAG